MKTIPAKHILTSLLLSLICMLAHAQLNDKQYVFANGFDHGLLQELVLEKLNAYRAQHGHQPLAEMRLLEQAAANQAAYMVKVRKETLEQEDGPESTRERLMHYGGSGHGAELVEKQNITLPGDTLTYNELADNICQNWIGAARYEEIFNNPAYNHVGLATALSTSGPERVYVSLVFGNYNSMPGNPEDRDKLTLPYEDDDQGIEVYDHNACKNSLSDEILFAVADNIKTEGNELILEFDRGKELKLWLRNEDDALALDILMEAQYPCGQDNILDYRLPGKGMLLEPVEADEIKEKLKRTGTSRVVLGELPDELTGNYQINVIAIKEEHFCQYITRAPQYTASAPGKDGTLPGKGLLLSDTLIFHHHLELLHLPERKKGEMVFIVPFEKGKTTFKEEDVLPIIESLEAPEFSISNVSIHAYSSLEGQHQANIEIQEQRAQSIADILQNYGQNIGQTEIQTSYNWKDFVRDISGSEYDSLTWRGMKNAQKSINLYGLAEELEPILKTHRYARVRMQVVYTLPDKASKHKYIIYKFNEAVQNNDRETALVWQKLIFKRIRQGEMPPEALDRMKIKRRAGFAGILMNQRWMQWKLSDPTEISQDMRDTILALYSLNPRNRYIIYNKLKSDIYYADIESQSQISDFEEELNDLIYSSFRMEYTNQLALDFYLYLSQKLKAKTPEHQRALNRLKDYASYSDSPGQAYSIALAFVKLGYYSFAADVLEPYLQQGNTQVCKLYLKAAGYELWRLYTAHYALALNTIIENEGKKACSYFDPESGISLRALENPAIKEIYCNKCKP